MMAHTMMAPPTMTSALASSRPGLWMRYFDLHECLVSESDILDGLVLSLR